MKPRKSRSELEVALALVSTGAVPVVSSSAVSVWASAARGKASRVKMIARWLRLLGIRIAILSFRARRAKKERRLA
jgi:hypothetical protein